MDSQQVSSSPFSSALLYVVQPGKKIAAIAAAVALIACGAFRSEDLQAGLAVSVAPCDETRLPLFFVMSSLVLITILTVVIFLVLITTQGCIALPRPQAEPATSQHRRKHSEEI